MDVARPFFIHINFKEMITEQSITGYFIFISLGCAVIMYFQDRLIKKYKKLLNDAFDRFDELYENSEPLTKFSIQCILKNAIEKEDYITAMECKRILEKYNNKETTK